MNQSDVAALMKGMAPAIKNYVDQATAPLLERIQAQEREIVHRKARAPERGEPGEPGRDGKDGRDGRDADPVSEEQIAKAVAAYLAANPPPAGRDGVDGRDGADGKDADLEALQAHCADLIAALPKPAAGKDGRDGVDGKDGDPGEKGADGIDGRDGADGVGLAGAMIDRDGELNVTLTNGEVRKLGPVIGRDGTDGERGAAGFSLTDFDTDWRPEDKVLILRWDAGETSYSHELFVPYVRDMGVWGEGKSYLKGDGVTWAGSFWIAQDDTADRPDAGKSWRLAVKRGRDGKDFAGPQPSTPPKVKVP